MVFKRWFNRSLFLSLPNVNPIPQLPTGPGGCRPPDTTRTSSRPTEVGAVAGWRYASQLPYALMGYPLARVLVWPGRRPCLPRSLVFPYPTSHSPAAIAPMGRNGFNPTAITKKERWLATSWCTIAILRGEMKLWGRWVINSAFYSFKDAAHP